MARAWTAWMDQNFGREVAWETPQNNGWQGRILPQCPTKAQEPDFYL